MSDEPPPVSVKTYGDLGMRGWRDLGLGDLSNLLVIVPVDRVGELLPIRRAVGLDRPAKRDLTPEGKIGWVQRIRVPSVETMSDLAEVSSPPVPRHTLILKCLQDGEVDAFITAADAIYRLPPEYWRTSYGEECSRKGEFAAPDYAGRLAVELLGYPVSVSKDAIQEVDRRAASRMLGAQVKDLAIMLQAILDKCDPSRTSKADVYQIASTQASMSKRTFDRLWPDLTAGTEWRRSGRKARRT